MNYLRPIVSIGHRLRLKGEDLPRPADCTAITISVVWYKTTSTARTLSWYRQVAMVEIRTDSFSAMAASRSPVHAAANTASTMATRTVGFTWPGPSFRQFMEACVRERALSAL